MVTPDPGVNVTRRERIEALLREWPVRAAPRLVGCRNQAMAKHRLELVVNDLLAEFDRIVADPS